MGMTMPLSGAQGEHSLVQTERHETGSDRETRHEGYLASRLGVGHRWHARRRLLPLRSLAGAGTGKPNARSLALLVSDVFHDKPIKDGAGIIGLDAPIRAEDAALVPMKLSILLPPDDPRKVKSITLVIDENPAPVAAVFEIGPKAKITTISTRVRVNQYTNVHAVAELSDGSLYSVMR